MKLTVTNALTDRAKRRIVNSFKPEAQDLANTIVEALEEMANSEAEFDESSLMEKVKELVTLSETQKAQEVEERIMKRLDAVRNSMLPSQERLSKKVRNEIFKAVLTTPRYDVERRVNDILVRNDVSGLAFADVVDYSIQDKWEDLNPLFSKFHRTPISKFHYTNADLYTVEVFAKGWKKTNAQTQDKVRQEIVALTRSISTKYVYAIQNVANEDIDDLEKENAATTFFQWLWNELSVTLVNSIVRTILLGDDINTTLNEIDTFETIGTKSTSDEFTTVANAAAATPTIKEVRELCDKIYNPNNKEKVLILNTPTRTQLSEFIYAAGGTVTYRSDAELAGQLGVSSLYVTDMLTSASKVACICMIPDEYWIMEKRLLQVNYPYYEKNVQRYMMERNIGGKIHGLLSTAVLKLP